MNAPVNAPPTGPSSIRRARLAPSVALGGVALFWIGIIVAAALEPGYRWRDDYVSSLASRGSSVAPIGMAAIAAMGAAFIAGGFEAQRAWGRRALSIPTVFSGAALLVVAACRTNCSGGAAGCGLGTIDAAVRDWVHHAHVYGVAVNEACLVAAMATMAVVAARRTAPWPRWLGMISVPLAVLSVGLLGRTGGADNGLLQRLWVAVNAAWLLTMVGAAAKVVRDVQVHRTP